MPQDLSNLIYVVDDDPAVLHSTGFLLEGEGRAVKTFAGGAELLAAFPGPPRPSCSSTTSCREWTDLRCSGG